ncbi:hypothetical protein A1Q2_06073 [Trichosporon asahii var. asahii CBS 8904]|uniref:Uncharacterized protein n=2 Tax=Trichosporon asahii var. asahii TaxID=189963 RepID=K1V6P9_TRIAC|nr:hypothetical protein A1Q1_07480 [Trichosporon asahii var. asahii CBS 2479]EJT51299.1 hypothetical protein A1Q1_07480 [Trichosporon asahii var. asahii CBS 2479]EKC99654.1 hypothetical protein A1Q2_06073 [Trichosporon asahii var. asahii CBS 8904]
MLKKLKSAQEALKTLVLESTSERIQRASRTLADSPIPTYLGPGNIGFGVTVGSEPSANFFAFTCARYGRAREEGWTGSAESSYLPRFAMRQFVGNGEEGRSQAPCCAMAAGPGNSPARAAATTHRHGAAYAGRAAISANVANTAMYTEWQWWTGRRGTGRICQRHYGTMARNAEEKDRLTAALDKVLEKATWDWNDAYLKSQLAKKVTAMGITAVGASAKRVYVKKGRDADRGPAGGLGFPSLTGVGLLCTCRYGTLARANNAEEKRALSRCLAVVCVSTAQGTLKVAFAAAAKAEGIKLSATGPPRKTKSAVTAQPRPNAPPKSKLQLKTVPKAKPV